MFIAAKFCLEFRRRYADNPHDTYKTTKTVVQVTDQGLTAPPSHHRTSLTVALVCLQTLVSVVATGGSLLLDVGPMPTGAAFLPLFYPLPETGAARSPCSTDKMSDESLAGGGQASCPRSRSSGLPRRGSGWTRTTRRYTILSRRFGPTRSCRCVTQSPQHSCCRSCSCCCLPFSWDLECRGHRPPMR